MEPYLLQIFGDIEPILHGPFANDEARDAMARKIKAERGDQDGLFKLYSDSRKIEVLMFTCDDLAGQ